MTIDINFSHALPLSLKIGKSTTTNYLIHDLNYDGYKTKFIEIKFIINLSIKNNYNKIK
ncbi:hypothetical protein TCT1_06750 [Xenorhabdus sp. TCT-1]|uniref:Uncharacterized protein n=1 Tax=Xenorhabdus taiwanensis TaxID=3085177 RepID=A0ABM8JTR3_9GAMM|nr:hypothetical protein TCT1_06750 [Xenorhabdus sp. TCT-1]